MLRHGGDPLVRGLAAAASPRTRCCLPADRRRRPPQGSGFFVPANLNSRAWNASRPRQPWRRAWRHAPESAGDSWQRLNESSNLTHPPKVRSSMLAGKILSLNALDSSVHEAASRHTGVLTLLWLKSLGVNTPSDRKADAPALSPSNAGACQERHRFTNCRLGLRGENAHGRTGKHSESSAIATGAPYARSILARTPSRFANDHSELSEF